MSHALRYNIWIVAVSFIAIVLPHPIFAMPGEKEKPYSGYTGTVHQFGFIGGLYNTANPNYSAESQTITFHDYGLGATYIMHDYVTRQFTFDIITSVSVITAKYLEMKNVDDSKQNIVWPIDCRFYLGPSEDFQAFIGTGLQWSLLEKTTGDYNVVSGESPGKTIHRLSGNTAIGFNFFGPQNYMLHINIGAKLHYPIVDNSETYYEGNMIDMAKDRSCVIVNGGITFDLDKRKNACLMINYEYPLGTPKPKNEKGNRGFLNRTQTLSLGIVFHIGGTR